ncbi:hypothetical protein PQO03_01340 [Lentisphaera profundi]|uniref:Uncharacterized protein n=1 Tax=Lentisphaera profundi TaxID=1658616 RepID=A0ABY7VUV8_9BACT|nr:hypothetical protein [Lentisphaera profundi]WDE96611.1 hypothetical protein PQO03_01340 [Lentisphaera profundi]
MEALATVCLVIGMIIALVFGIILLMKAFKESLLWGLGYIFVPFVSLFFVIMHWEEAKSSFLKGLIAVPFYALGIFLMPVQ